MKPLWRPTLLLTCSINTVSQIDNLYPRPQQVDVHASDVETSKLDIKILKPGDKSFKKYKDKIMSTPGAYYLHTKRNIVTIATQAQVGEFYARQTLNQLYNNHHLPQVEIIDYPHVQYRGVVEGFYGAPWSHANRLDLLSFYGKHKMNTYIYGPKDDPYHSSPYWRKPYPSDQANQIVELLETANENKVDFF